MDSAVLSYLALAAASISNGLQVWNFFQSPARKNAEALDKLIGATTALEKRTSDQIAAVERRVAALEDAYKHVPDKESFHELKLAIERMNSDIRVTNQVLVAVKENSNLTRDFVLKNGGGD